MLKNTIKKKIADGLKHVDEGIKIALKKGGELWDDLDNVIYNNITSKIIRQECPAGGATVSNLPGNTSEKWLELYNGIKK